LRLSSFGGYGLALAALALVVVDAYDTQKKFLVARKKWGQGKKMFCHNIKIFFFESEIISVEV